MRTREMEAEAVIDRERELVSLLEKELDVDTDTAENLLAAAVNGFSDYNEHYRRLFSKESSVFRNPFKILSSLPIRFKRLGKLVGRVKDRIKVVDGRVFFGEIDIEELKRRAKKSSVPLVAAITTAFLYYISVIVSVTNPLGAIRSTGMLGRLLMNMTVAEKLAERYDIDELVRDLDVVPPTLIRYLNVKHFETLSRKIVYDPAYAPEIKRVFARKLNLYLKNKYKEGFAKAVARIDDLDRLTIILRYGHSDVITHVVEKPLTVNELMEDIDFHIRLLEFSMREFGYGRRKYLIDKTETINGSFTRIKYQNGVSLRIYSLPMVGLVSEFEIDVKKADIVREISVFDKLGDILEEMALLDREKSRIVIDSRLFYKYFTEHKNIHEAVKETITETNIRKIIELYDSMKPVYAMTLYMFTHHYSDEKAIAGFLGKMDPETRSSVILYVEKMLSSPEALKKYNIDPKLAEEIRRKYIPLIFKRLKT